MALPPEAASGAASSVAKYTLPLDKTRNVLAVGLPFASVIWVVALPLARSRTSVLEVGLKCDFAMLIFQVSSACAGEDRAAPSRVASAIPANRVSKRLVNLYTTLRRFMVVSCVCVLNDPHSEDRPSA